MADIIFAGDVYGNLLAELLRSEWDGEDQPFADRYGPADIIESDRLTLLSDVKDFLFYNGAHEKIDALKLSAETTAKLLLGSANNYHPGFDSLGCANGLWLHRWARTFSWSLYERQNDTLGIDW